MQATFERALPITLAFEGGFSKDRRDPGNWTGGKVGKGVLKGTKYGISAAAFPGLDIEHLTIAQVGPIYRDQYWRPVRGDDLPPGVDLVTFDAGVNSGPSRGVKWTQGAAGVAQDGKVGPATLAAVKRLAPAAIVRGATDRRLRFLQGLSTWKSFGRGWGRRVGEVRAHGLAFAGESAAAIRQDADGLEADGRADGRKSGSAGAGGAAAGGGAVTADQVASIDWQLIAGIGIAAAVLIAVAIFLRARARAKREAADAARAVAAKMETA